MSKEIVVVAGQRTPFGAFGGSLKDVSATDLSVSCSKAALASVGLNAGVIDHVVIGNVVQSGADAAYLPRHVGLKLGVAQDKGALGVNRLCGSGFQSWVNAVQMIRDGESEVVLAGGTEQMSLIPFVIRGVRFGGIRLGNGQLEDLMTSALTDSYAGLPMALTAENLGEKYGFSREEVDLYALMSQSRYATALKNEVFEAEISPFEISVKGVATQITKDEHPRETTLEKLAALKPLFKKDGFVTAGTASGIVDGAASSILMSAEKAKELKLKPRAKILGYASVGCDPKIMGIGPVGAIRKLLQKTGMDQKQIDLFEVNEAFAVQYLAVEKELGLPRDRTNVNGGAIAIGHPLGASGTRIMNHLVDELHRRNAKYAIGSACIGGGQGIAVLIERA